MISPETTFIFETPTRVGGQEITAVEQNEFRSDFAIDLRRLELWAGAERWAPLPVSTLHITVSDNYRISKALYPAWAGQPGRMQFPAHRVRSRAAAIAHELTHVFFANSNRFLAEGFAVYIQDKIGANSAFPNFGQPLHLLARERLCAISADISAAACRDPTLIITDLDRVATPSPLVLTIRGTSYGQNASGQGALYLVAGSFVQYLVETRGLERFRVLYVETPMVPGTQVAGSAKRWHDVFGAPLEYLELEWRAAIAQSGQAS